MVLAYTGKKKMRMIMKTKSLILTIISTLLLAPISFTHPVEAAYEPSQQEIDQLA